MGYGSSGDAYESIRRVTSFDVTDEHLTLLRHMYVCWDDMEFGAPGIDPKRPYGNSDVLGDMAEILDYEVLEDEDMPDDLADYLMQVHAEMGVVLQIVLTTGQMAAGNYVSEGYGEWRRFD